MLHVPISYQVFMKLSWFRLLECALLLIGSVVVTVAGIELAMRVVGYTPVISQAWVLGSRTPNKDVITISRKFLNEAFYEVSPTRETIVTIGDSFTEGWPVGKDHTYPAVLRRQLSHNGWKVNVVNMGMVDSGPDQHLRLFKQYLLPRVKPDIVIWTFYVNDLGDNILYSVYGLEGDTLIPFDASEHWINIRQRLYDYIPLPYSMKQNSRTLRLLFKALEIWGRRRNPGGTLAERMGWSKAKIRLGVEELGRLARAHRFETYFVLIAPQSMYFRNADPENPSAIAYADLHELLVKQPNFINARFSETRVPSHGPNSDERQTPADLVSAIFADGSRDGNTLGDRHFNEIGYRWLADAVAKRLLDDRHRSVEAD